MGSRPTAATDPEAAPADPRGRPASQAIPAPTDGTADRATEPRQIVEEGGDPACWAHLLFDDDEAGPASPRDFF